MRTTLWAIAAAMTVACGGKDADSGAPPEDELVFEDLGSAEVHDTGGFTGELTLDVPEGAVSALAHCGNYGDDALGAVWYLDNPGGTRVWDGDAPDTTSWRAEFLDDTAPLLLSITPKTPLSAGAWSANWWIGRGNPGSVDCGVVYRVDEVGSAATILVDLVFVAVPGLDAAGAEASATFGDALAQLETEWASAGITPIYNYVDFSGDVAKYGVVDVTDDDYSEFNDLLRTAAPNATRTLTFFLVEEIANNSAGGATILGLSAGPPGAAGIHGTSKSGVVVSTIDIETDAVDVGKIMAHEGGHFLGLYHTTESDGGMHDPLGDTPECPASNDADANGTVNTSECGGKGAENVMWWTLTSGDATMTADQGWVARRSPIAD